MATVTSPFEVSLDGLDVVDINAVRFDPKSVSVVLRDAAGDTTTSAALAASLHGFLMDGIHAATLFIVGEVTARLHIRPGSGGSGDVGSECDSGACSSSISISAWSSGAPGSTNSSCSASTTGVSGDEDHRLTPADRVCDPVTNHIGPPNAVCVPSGKCADDAGADADASGSSSGSGSGSGSSSNDDRRMRFGRLGYVNPAADAAADEFARDGAPSCRLYIAQKGHIIASSVDVASYEPVFLTDAEVSPSFPVTLLIALGGSSLDARDLHPPRPRFKGTIMEVTIDPHHFNDDEDRTVSLLQTHPLVDAAWNSACLRLRLSHADAFCAKVHVIGASGLPRRGVTHEIFRYLAPVFALVMQTNVEMTSAARALTDKFMEMKDVETELRRQAMNPSFAAFMANRTETAVVNVTVAAADFLLPEALELSRETLEALAANRSDCSRSTSEPSGDRSDGAGQSDHGNHGDHGDHGAMCSRSTSSESGNASEGGKDSGGSSSGHCSRSTSSSSGVSDRSVPGSSSYSTSSSSYHSQSKCSRSSSEGVPLLQRRNIRRRKVE